MTAWRKEPPTVDEVQRNGSGPMPWWWRASDPPILPWSLVEVSVAHGAVCFDGVFDDAPVDEPVEGAFGTWAPCSPPSEVPPAPVFPAEVTEAAREALRLDGALARAILATAPATERK